MNAKNIKSTIIIFLNIKKLALKDKCEITSLSVIDNLVRKLSVLRNKIYESSLRVQLSLTVKEDGTLGKSSLLGLRGPTNKFGDKFYRAVDNQNDDTKTGVTIHIPRVSFPKDTKEL
jgi:hypothetical protein